MKTGLQQHAALSQQLRINPRLYQAMDLLYMPLLDLQQHLKQELLGNPFLDRKSTRLNSSHGYISYAVFCLKKKKKTSQKTPTLIKTTDKTHSNRMGYRP